MYKNFVSKNNLVNLENIFNVIQYITWRERIREIIKYYINFFLCFVSSIN